MKFSKAFKIALNIIFHSKLRSWLTIIGVVIGVASIISIVSIGSGFEKDVQKQLGGLGSDTITITPGFDRANECPGPNCRQRPGEKTSGGKFLTSRDVQALRSIPDISIINPSIGGSVNAYYLGETASISIDGVDPSVWKLITTSDIEFGRLLGTSDTNSVVIGSSVAKSIFKNRISLNRQLIIGGKPFMVVGILKESGGFGMDDRKIFMPYFSAREVLAKSDNYDSIVVRVKDRDEVDAVVSSIEKKLMIVRHVNPDTKDFTVMSMKAIQQRVSAVLAGFTLFLGVIAAVSLLVGAVGIANTMFTSVLERTREIGIMKALGAKNFDIMLIFLLNSGLVGLVGGLIGVLFGVLIAVLIPKAGISFVSGGQPLTTFVPLNLIIFTLLFSLFLGMISGIIPAYRASKLSPVEALRSE